MSKTIMKMSKRIKDSGGLASLLIASAATAFLLLSGCNDNVQAPAPIIIRTSLCGTPDNPTPAQLNGCNTPPGTGGVTSALAGGLGGVQTASTALRSAGALVNTGTRSSLGMEAKPNGISGSADYATDGGLSTDAATAKPSASPTPMANLAAATAKTSAPIAARTSTGGGPQAPIMGSAANMSGDMKTAANDLTAPGPGPASGNGTSPDVSAESGGGGGGAAKGRGPASDGFGNLFGDKSGGDGGMKQAISFLSAEGVVNPMGTPDPDDYFSRLSKDKTLFEVVSTRYRRTTMKWPLESANRLTGATRLPASAQVPGQAKLDGIK